MTIATFVPGGYTYVKFLEGWQLSLVTSPVNATPDQVKQIALDKILADRPYPNFSATIADFRTVGLVKAHCPPNLKRTIVEYLP